MPSLDITFIGHACFLLQCGDARLLTDPYSPAIGYDAVDLAVDVVTLSHLNPKYHSCLDDVQAATVYRGLEQVAQSVESGPFELQSVEVFEKLPDSGPNAMVIIEVAGIRVAHMGDCGHLPTEAQIEACGDVDVLLALAGAGPTLPLPDLMKFIEAIEPKIVIPMHYGVPALDMKIAPVEELEALWSGEIVRGGSSFSISRESWPAAPILRVLTPLRLRA